MSERSFFQRSPRMKPSIPNGQIEIVKPPNPPIKPEFSFSSFIVPIATTVLMGVVMFYVYSRQYKNGSTSVIYLVSYCVMGLSYVLMGLTHIFKVRHYKKLMLQREDDYVRRMNQYRTELEQYRDTQSRALCYNDPTPDECVEFAQKKVSRLWERSPKDDDFLFLRLGIGKLPMSIEVKPPRKEEFELDPLIDIGCQLAADFNKISDVPIRLPLYDSKVVGIVGERPEVLSAVRGILVQLTTHHSPDEVKIATFFSSYEEREWEWIRWFPHIWDDERKLRFLAKDKQTAHHILDYLYELLNRRKLEQHSSKQTSQLPAWVFICPAPYLIENEPIFPMLLKEAQVIGACTILLADKRESLPMDCSVIVEVGTESGRFIETDFANGVREQNFIPDSISVECSESLARALAPLRLKTLSAAEIPSILTFMEMFGASSVDDLRVLDKWTNNRFPHTLPVPIGVRAGGKPVLLNIHDKIERKGHGPHGLLAGTTGSGKSEVIQSIIASLAVQFHPHDVTFMLIDYKGGGMSNTFVDLPHVIASITNLEGGGLIERAKVSLKAELQRRQKLFNEAGNLQHIDEYFRSPMREIEPLPHLVIVIDEFAELKRDHPEFMSELISIAAIGRTLGVHLILATQKPAGVVDDKIWSNSRFRICLRVQDEGDSRDMLKMPDAAWIRTPGRGYLQVGSNEVFELFQSAWSGAAYQPEKNEVRETIDIKLVDLNGTTKKLYPEASGGHSDSGTKKATNKQLQVVTQYLGQLAQSHNIPRLPGPWTPPLPKVLYLDNVMNEMTQQWNVENWEQMNADEWLTAVIGLSDDIYHQRQDPATINLQEGHIAIYGMPGTGKTTFLQTLILSLVLRHSPRDLNVYILDFGRVFRDFAKLPHVGGVVLDDETEKILRLFRMLVQELNVRKDIFSTAGTKTLAAYQNATGKRIPVILVCIDGYVSFKNMFPNEHEQFEQLVREGGNFGIYFVFTAYRVSDVYERVKSNFSSAVSFELADVSEYYMVVGRPSRPLSNAPEGRAFMKGTVPPLEFQTAFPTNGEDESTRTSHLRELVSRVADAWKGRKATPIPMLPDELSLYEIMDEQPGKTLCVPLGLEVDTLEKLYVDLLDGPYFIVTGRMEGGKTSLLNTWMLALAYHNSPDDLQIYLIDSRRTSTGISSLRRLPHVKEWADELKITEILQMLRNLVEERRPVLPMDDEGISEINQFKYSSIVLVIDDIDTLLKTVTTIQSDLEYIVRHGRDKNIFVIVSGIVSEMNGLASYQAKWLGEIRAAQKGFMLGSSDLNDLQFFNLRLHAGDKSEMLPPGNGLFVKRGYTKIKIAQPFQDDLTPLVWAERMMEKWIDSRTLTHE